MDKEQLRNGIEFVTIVPPEKIGLVMYFILKEGESFALRKADIDENAMSALRDKFLNYIAETFITNDELHFAGITTSDKRNNAAYFFDLDELPKGLQVMGQVLDNPRVRAFNFKQDAFKNIFGFVFVLASSANKIAIYKKQYPINLLGRDVAVRLIVKDVKSKTRLVKVNEDIINVNEKFEFMQIGDEVIVVNVGTLEKYFGFEDVIRSSAETNLQTIQKANLLVDVEPLREMISDLRYARKLMRVKAAPAVLELSFAKVQYFIQHHPKLKGRIKFNPENTRILLDTKVSKQLFLKLLDDDFLRSDLTDILYEAEIKDRLSNQEAPE
jgi:hypothetical protein